MKDRANRRKRRPQPNEKRDETQVADGRVGQQALQVLSKQRNQSGKRHRHQTGGGDDAHEQFGPPNHRRKSCQQEDARFNHGGGV